MTVIMTNCLAIVIIIILLDLLPIFSILSSSPLPSLRLLLFFCHLLNRSRDHRPNYFYVVKKINNAIESKLSW